MHSTRKQLVSSLHDQLEHQSTETLEDIASFQKLTWRSICVESVGDPPKLSPRKHTKGIDLASKRTLDVMSTATLSDLRVVLSIMLGNVHNHRPNSTSGSGGKPSSMHKPPTNAVDFVFCRNKDVAHVIDMHDERHIRVQDILQHGNTVYVRYQLASTLKSPTKPRRLHSVASTSTDINGGESPTFAITNTFCGYMLNADLFLRGDGVSITLKDIVDSTTSVAAAELHVDNAEVHVTLTSQQLGEIVGFSDDTLHIMMSTSKNQRTILQKLLAKLTVHLDDSTKLIQVTFPSDAIATSASLISLGMIQKVSSMRKPSPRTTSVVTTPMKKETMPPQVDSTDDIPSAVPFTAAEKSVRLVPHFTLPPAKPELEHSPSSVPKHVDHSVAIQPEDSASAVPWIVTATPLTSDFDKAFLSALEFFTESPATPAMYSLVAYDELVLSFGVEAGGSISKVSKYLLHARDALKKVLLHCILQYTNSSGHYTTRPLEDNSVMATLLRYLWRGLGHCVWREVRDEIFARCRLDPMTRLGVLQSKLGNAEIFSGFKDELDRNYSDEVVVVVHCVLLCLEPHDISSVDPTNVWKHAQAIGLHEFKAFRKTLKRLETFCRNRVLPPHVRRRLLEWVALPSFLSIVDRKDDVLYGVTLLRKLVTIVLDATDLDLVQPSKLAECLAQASATKVSTTVSGITGDLVKMCNKWVESHATPTGFPEFQAMVKCMDEIRCAHIEATCTLVANAGTNAPIAFRWYLPPIPTTKQDRYFFVGEHDAAFEFTYIYNSTKSPVPVQFNTMGEPTLTPDALERLLLCALSRWYSSQAPTKLTAPLNDCVVGFGVNFCLYSALDTLGKAWWLDDILKAATIEKIGIGSGVSVDGFKSIIVLRLYGVSWRRASHAMKEPMHFLLWLKYMSGRDVHHAVRLGALCICELLLSKDACKSILPLISSKTATSTIPLGLAAEVYEMLVLSWQDPPHDQDQSPLSWHFPYVMGLIQQNKMIAHFTVKILERLCALLTSESNTHYVAAIMCQRTIHDSNDDRDMVELLAKITFDVNQPVRVLDLAQRILLECLLHPILGTPLRIARLFARISDSQLGFRLTRKPAPHGDISISPDKCTHLLSLGILGKLARAVESLMEVPESQDPTDLNTLQLRFLCVLATAGGGVWLAKNIHVVRLVVACIHRTKSSLVCLQGGRVLQTLSCVLASGDVTWSSSDDPRAHMELIDLIGTCVSFETDQVGSAVAVHAVSALANLLPVSPWGEWSFTTLKSMLTTDDAGISMPWSSYLHCMVPMSRLDRLCHLLCCQHQSVKKCACKGAIDMDARRRIVRKTACTFAASILQHLFLASKPVTLDYVRKVQAKKIQQTILRWMYVKRKTRGFLPVVAQYSKCPHCSPVSSCLATLILLACGFQVDAHTRKPSKARGGVVAFQLDLFQFLNRLWHHRELVMVACNDLKVAFTYLVFSSHNDADIRYEALKSLSLLTWFYPTVINFVVPAIVKPLWGASYFGDVGGTWIEDVLHKSLDSNRKRIGQHIPEVQNALNFFALVSIDPRLAGHLTRGFGFVWKLIYTWTSSDKTHALDEAVCVALVFMQNVLLNLSIGDDFRFNVPINDFVTVLTTKNIRVKAGLCGVLWAIALRDEGRAAIRSHPDCNALLQALTVSVFNSFAHSDTAAAIDMHMLLYNGLGALACMALDTKLLRELMQSKVNEPACAMAAWIKNKKPPSTNPLNIDCAYFATMEELLTKDDMPSYVRVRMKQLKTMHEYGVGPKLGFRAISVLTIVDQVHVQSTRLLATILVVETKLITEWQVLLSSFTLANNPTLYMYLCAVLPTLARAEKSRASAIPPFVLQSLSAIITQEKWTKLQAHAIQALGHLSVVSTAAKTQVQSLDVCTRVPKLPPAVQSEVVHMIALSTKTPDAGQPILGESEVYDVVGAVLKSRDRAKIWQCSVAEWSPLYLDDKDLNSTLETAVIKYLRRPVELVQQYSGTAHATTLNFPLTLLQLLGEVLHEMPHLVQRKLKDAQELTLELSQTLRKWTSSPSCTFRAQCITIDCVAVYVQVMQHCIHVNSPSLTDDITAIMVAVVANQPSPTDLDQVVQYLTQRDSVVHMHLHVLSNSTSLKNSTTIQALTLLHQLFLSNTRKVALGYLETFTSTDNVCGFLCVLHVLMEWPDHRTEFSALAFGVLQCMLESTTNRTLLLDKVVPRSCSLSESNAALNLYTKYVLDVWSFISVKEMAARVPDRSKRIGLCLLASQILCDLCNEAQTSSRSESFVSILIGSENNYVAHATLSHIVQSYVACTTDERLVGEFLEANVPAAQIEQLRFCLSAALAYLATNENVRHSNDMVNFIDSATARPITSEAHLGIQFNLLQIYNAVLCVPTLFRQIVFRQHVFTTSERDKPMLALFGEYIAHPNNVELRWVAAELAGKFCLDGTLAIEKSFLVQSADCLEACFSKSFETCPFTTTPACSELTARIRHIDEAIPSIEENTHHTPDRRLVHELLSTLLMLFRAQPCSATFAHLDADKVARFFIQTVRILRQGPMKDSKIISPSMMEQLVVAIGFVHESSLASLLCMLEMLFSVSTEYKCQLLSLNLTSSLAASLATANKQANARYTLSLLSFLSSLVNNDTSVHPFIVQDKALLRQIFSVLQLRFQFVPEYKCMSLQHPNGKDQIGVLVAAAKVLHRISSTHQEACTMFQDLELDLPQSSKASQNGASVSVEVAVSNDRPILRTLLDLLLASESNALQLHLLGICLHLAEANGVYVVVRLCGHGGIQILFDLIFHDCIRIKDKSVQLLRVLILQSEMNVPRPTLLLSAHPAAISTSSAKLDRYAKSARSVVAPPTRRTTTVHKTGKPPQSRFNDDIDAVPVESVALIIGRIVLCGLFPVYGRRLEDLTLGSQATQIDFIWIEDMLRRLVVFGLLSPAELQIVSRCMTIQRYLAHRTILTEPGLHIITSGKVLWQLETALDDVSLTLDKGCIVGVSTCLGLVSTEKATAMCAVVALVLTKHDLEHAIPAPIQAKIHAAMRKMATVYPCNITEAPSWPTYLSLFKLKAMQRLQQHQSQYLFRDSRHSTTPPEDVCDLIASVCSALSLSKDIARVNVSSLVQLITDAKQWLPSRQPLTRSLVYVVHSYLRAQPQPNTRVHSMLLRLGRPRGGSGAAFVANTWTASTATDDDIPFLNRVFYVLGQFTSYCCTGTGRASCGKVVSKSKCSCTLVARRVVMSHVRLSLFRDTMILMDSSTSPIRIDHSIVFAVCGHLFRTQNYKLAQYLSTLPTRLVHAFVDDAINFSEESPSATRLLGKVCRSWLVTSVVECLSDRKVEFSQWFTNQVQVMDHPAHVASLGPLECLISLAHASSASLDFTATVLDHLERGNAAILSTLCLGFQSSDPKMQLRAARTLTKYCDLATKQDRCANILEHDALLEALTQVYLKCSHELKFQTCACDAPSKICVRCEPKLPYRQNTLLLNIIKTLGTLTKALLSSFRHRNAFLEPTMRFVHVLLQVIELDRFGQQVMTGLCSLYRCLVHTVDAIEYAYLLMHSLHQAYERHHEIGMRALLPLVSTLPLADPPHSTIRANIHKAFVELTMAIMAIPTPTLQHLCANAILRLCQSATCAAALSHEHYLTQICHVTASGVSLQSLVSVTAALCTSKATRHRIVAFPHYLEILIGFLPRLQRHQCLVGAAYIVWKLMKIRPEHAAVYNQAISPSFFSLLEDTVAWQEAADEKTRRVTVGAGVLTQLLAIPANRQVEAASLGHIVCLCCANLSKESMARQVPLLYRLLQCVNMAFQQGHAYVRQVAASSINIARWIELAAQDNGTKLKLHSEVCKYATEMLRHHENRMHLRHDIGCTEEVWNAFLPSMFAHNGPSQSLASRLAFELCRGHRRNSTFFIQNRLLVALDNVLLDITTLDLDTLRTADVICCTIGRVCLYLEPKRAPGHFETTSGLTHLIEMVQRTHDHRVHDRPWFTLVCSAFRAINCLVRVLPPATVHFKPVQCAEIMPSLVPQPRAFVAFCTSLRLTCAAARNECPTAYQVVLHHLVSALSTETLAPSGRKVAWKLFGTVARHVMVEVDGNAIVQIVEQEVKMPPLAVVHAMGLTRFTSPLVVLGYATIELHTDTTFHRLHLWIVIAVFASQQVNPTSWALERFVRDICNTVAILLESSEIEDQDSAAYIIATLCCHSPSAATLFASIIPDAMDLLTQCMIGQLKRGHRAVYASRAAACLIAVRDSGAAEDDLASHLAILFPLLSTALYNALSKNFLTVAIHYLDVTLEILQTVAKHNIASKSLHAILFNPKLLASLSIAILKETHLPIPLKSLMCSSSLTTICPDVPPFCDLSRSKLLQLAHSLLRLLKLYSLSCDIFVTDSKAAAGRTAITTEQYWDFLHCLATLLHPKYSSKQLCQAFVEVNIHQHLVSLLQLLRAWPNLLSQVLLILTNLLASHPPCRDLPVECLLDIVHHCSNADAHGIAGHAFNVLWHLSRHKPNQGILFQSTDVMSFIQFHLDKAGASIGVEGCFGLLAIMTMVDTMAGPLEAYVSKPGRDVAWVSQATVGDSASLVSSQFCKFMRNLAFTREWGHVVRGSSVLVSTLIQCLRFPCSKTALYALQCLTKLPLPMAQKMGLFQSLAQHLQNGLSPTSGQQAPDTIHTSRGVLATRCLHEYLSLSALTLHSIVPGRPKWTLSPEPFSLLLRVALFGPNLDQLLALQVARLYFGNVRCDTCFFEGTQFVLECTLACLGLPRDARNEALLLFECVTRSRGVQYLILDNAAALTTLRQLFHEPHTKLEVLWRIVRNLSTAQSQQVTVLTLFADVILATKCPSTPDETTIARLACSLVAHLVTTIETLPCVKKLHPWFRAMALTNDAQVLAHLCRVQRNLVKIGAASHDIVDFEHVLDNLLPIYSACPSSDDPILTTQLRIMLSEFCGLMLTFYKTETQNMFAGFQLQATTTRPPTRRSTSNRVKQVRLWQHKWVFCNGAPMESPRLFEKVLSLWAAACTHACQTVAHECLYAILTFFVMVTSECLSGCFLMTDALSIAFILQHLPQCTTSDVELIMAILKACAKVRIIATKFAARCSAASARTGDNYSMLELLCGVAAHVVRVEMIRGPSPAHNNTFTIFLACLSVLSENTMFLRSEFLMTSRNNFGVIKLLVYVVHRCRSVQPSLASLAAKILVRLVIVANLRHVQKLLKQTACDLCLTDENVARVLLTCVHLTLFEFDMQVNVLVRVVHSVLVRMVANGRIDKGTPALLRDNGLENISVALREFMAAYDDMAMNPNTNDDASIVVHWLKTLSSELSKYCVDGYDSLYDAFERSNHNTQLTQGIEATKHAAMCYQTSHYVVHLLKEAVVHAIDDPTQHADITLFFRRVESIVEWIILSLQNPDMDIGYFTHHIEELCAAVRGLLHVHAPAAVGSPAASTASAPVALVLEQLHIHSWMWAFWGFRPYVKTSLGQRRAYTGFCTDGGSTVQCRYPQLQTHCGNYTAKHASTAFVVYPDEMTESVDVQVWMYLPFSPTDMCIGQTSLSFPLACGNHSIEFHPFQRDKMRFDEVRPYGDIQFRVCQTHGTASTTASSFPFSTCGSKMLRNVCFLLWTGFVLTVQGVWHLVQSHARAAPRALHVHGSAKWQPAHETNAALRVTSLLTQIRSTFEKCTSKDKLIGSYEKQSAHTECKTTMDLLLESDVGSFAAMTRILVPILTNPTNKSLCDQTWAAIAATVDLYMPRGLSYFKSHLHVHEARDATPSALVRRKYRLKEVCNGIAGLDFFVQSTKPSTDSFFKHFRPSLVQPHVHRYDVAVIVDTWRRRRGQNWQQLVIPHMSIFSLPQARMPEWYGLSKMVAPDNLNHFFLQPLERWQAIFVIAEFTSACFNQPLRTHATPLTALKLTSSTRRLSNVELAQTRLVSALSAVRHVLSGSSRVSSDASLSPTTALVKQASARHSQFIRTITDLTKDSKPYQLLKHIELARKCRLATFADLDPFDARSKLKVFNARAQIIPPILYNEGPIAELINVLSWFLLTVTVWRLALALDTIREASRTYNGLVRKKSQQVAGSPAHRRNTMEVTWLMQPNGDLSVSATVLRTEKQLRYYLVITELMGLLVDIFYIWPPENGKIGLGGFWSSLWFTAIAFGFPFLFEYFVSPTLQDSMGVVSVGKLSILACSYGILWVVLAFLSVVTITRSIPGFNATRRVESINLTDFPSCLKNYLAIGSIGWELVQLNSIPWQIWKSTYSAKKLAAMVTLDFATLGFDVVQLNVFLIKQRVACICLLIWFFSLKASNKFKRFPWVNYFVTFLLPSFLSTGLFMVRRPSGQCLAHRVRVVVSNPRVLVLGRVLPFRRRKRGQSVRVVVQG
ncbi:hypothetical protein, variant 4 [Aphanomyces invadans]|uniref:Uncharacterized protein n=1 Tax=Aphanomyces invadans TaxID=157072 RepID=A0A024U4U2_9STRA|nr:hypothetical protein, variant 2 [Aphanomyces invadans]XP_008870395.1 hypothetical protein, variant 3 [Aphanomyces invadans]XP_008870396.1 hypothetical protein, variant 4 [Aphanomyces invadans]ETW01396.1 hypothetical protein, variant 2 [Aphanomyces invadans]ETW01397.1 hypothetical protein, variant 3 [Aphanomyces invadans]ETW01398.1 hypothetical protein, variant 4 [Aphanomyces invadans]|eukprot:XP_008870394.1 hypothetical protein, variant 2 [Aphanomyces invadans]